MIVVGCDPDTVLVALARELNGNWETWLTEFPRSLRILDLITEWLCLAAGDDSDRHFVAENQFVYRNWKTGLQLAAARGRIEAAAMRAGYEIHDAVNPETWRSAILRLKRGTPREECKRVSLHHASMISGVRVADHNVADAMGIQMWAANRIRMARTEAERGII